MRTILFFVVIIACVGRTVPASAAGGSLTLTVEDEASEQPTITRLELWRGPPKGKTIGVARTVPAGLGVVLDRRAVLTLTDHAYSFRMIRGPEYRIVSGTFTLERTSLDDHNVRLPRMVLMREKGWTSGDCCVVASANSLPLRMASEDLHMATVLGHIEAKPIPHRDEPIKHDPTWIREDAVHRDGLIFYGVEAGGADSAGEKELLPVQRIAAIDRENSETKVAIENPFAWPLPVWLASEKIDGLFVMGDWLRLDRKVMTPPDRGRPADHVGFGGGQAMGRWGEEIYRHIIDAGLRIPPLAGGGSDSAMTPVGYNRLYVGWPLEEYEEDGKLEARPATTAESWWNAAWKGHSIATNGPLLRPKLGGKIPGHVFTAQAGEVLELQPELTLTVRDPVEYLEVIKNGTVFYSARLDEFAKAGGIMPAMQVDESSWVIMRVVTLHEDHYRAAVSAPWYIDFDNRPRVGKNSVDFFQKWLTDYEDRLKRLPPAELQRHVPFVRAARKFWAEKAKMAVK